MESVIDIRGLGLTFERDGRRTEVLRELDLSIPRGAFESLGISEANLASVRSQLGEKLAEAQATLAA